MLVLAVAALVTVLALGHMMVVTVVAGMVVGTCMVVVALVAMHTRIQERNFDGPRCVPYGHG